jgi:hypothetical protein
MREWSEFRFTDAKGSTLIRGIHSGCCARATPARRHPTQKSDKLPPTHVLDLST